MAGLTDEAAMSPSSSRVVICGAGMAGVAAAHQLAVEYGVDNVVLVDEGNPLSLTSDKSTEAYRNLWPGPDWTMTAFMNRSIDIIEGIARGGLGIDKLTGSTGLTTSSSMTRRLARRRPRATSFWISGARSATGSTCGSWMPI